MKKVVPLVLALLAGSVFSQTSTLATATRARNGKLISLTNIQGLRDCETENFVGEVRKIGVEGNLVHFQLWQPQKGEGTMEKIKEKVTGKKKIKETQKIEIDLNWIAPMDRAVIFNDLIRKSFTLRVAGYACTSDEVVSAFSIDLVY